MEHPNPADLPALVLSLAQDLLERDDVALDDDFFSAGGDSIIAMHLVSQLARQTGLRLRVSLMFANPVLRDFAARIEEQQEAAYAADPGVPLTAVSGPTGNAGHAQ